MNNKVFITVEGIDSIEGTEVSIEGTEVSITGTEARLNLPEIEAFALNALDLLKKRRWDLSLFFCDNNTIRGLNKQYRTLDESTDVLSFVMGETDGERFLPGDIVISVEKTLENARGEGIAFTDELRRLLIHGMLHLAGMDHASNGAEEPMLVLQERLLKKLQGR